MSVIDAVRLPLHDVQVAEEDRGKASNDFVFRCANLATRDALLIMFPEDDTVLIHSKSPAVQGKFMVNVL